MKRSQWDNLIIERRAAAPPLDDHQFRSWMAGLPIFVSSVMDDEMMPAREAARAWITAWGGEPVMWEEITPRDQRAQDAYLDGVDRSDLFLLFLGSRYGVRDASGYSPTNQEEIRAKQRCIPRLLFERAGMSPSQRAGELNDWLRSLYSEVSTGTYAGPDDLVVSCVLVPCSLVETGSGLSPPSTHDVPAAHHDSTQHVRVYLRLQRRMALADTHDPAARSLRWWVGCPKHRTHRAGRFRDR